MEVTQLQITRLDIFKNLCDSAYGQIDEDTFSYMTSNLNQLTSAQGITNLFKEGLTCCMVPDFMERIEHFTDNKMPFIIIVTDKRLPCDDEYIFAVVNGEDVSF